MSDLAATGCCNNDCGCGMETCGGNNSWLWILILLFCCGGWGNNTGNNGGCGCGLGRGDDCGCIIPILLILCCCGGF